MAERREGTRACARARRTVCMLPGGSRPGRATRRRPLQPGSARRHLARRSTSSARVAANASWRASVAVRSKHNADRPRAATSCEDIEIRQHDTYDSATSAKLMPTRREPNTILRMTHTRYESGAGARASSPTIVRSVPLQGHRVKVRLKPDTTYYTGHRLLTQSRRGRRGLSFGFSASLRLCVERSPLREKIRGGVLSASSRM